LDQDPIPGAFLAALPSRCNFVDAYPLDAAQPLHSRGNPIRFACQKENTNYSAVSIGATLGAGAGGSQFENNKGVFLSVKSKTEGIGLSLGVSGVQIEFVK
jgi:hypothetical protein